METGASDVMVDRERGRGDDPATTATAAVLEWTGLALAAAAVASVVGAVLYSFGYPYDRNQTLNARGGIITPGVSLVERFRVASSAMGVYAGFLLLGASLLLLAARSMRGSSGRTQRPRLLRAGADLIAMTAAVVVLAESGRAVDLMAGHVGLGSLTSSVSMAERLSTVLMAIVLVLTALPAMWIALHARSSAVDAAAYADGPIESDEPVMSYWADDGMP